MIFYIFISIISLVALVAFHELGHFLVAKKLGVKVEEFGIGIPPRIFAKKFKETVYSLNLLPIGAFVRLYGEDKKIKDNRSFSEKSIFHRILILLGGVVAFWIIAFILLTFVMFIGFESSIDDTLYAPNAKVIVIDFLEGYPSEKSGIKKNDTILSLSLGEKEILVNKQSDVTDFLEENKGEEISFLIKRGDLIDSFNLISNEEKGVMGFYLLRVDNKRYPWYEAPFQGAVTTGRATINTAYLLGTSVKNLIIKEPMPIGVKVTGPVGIVRDFFIGSLERGISDYLQVMALVSISLAIFNLIPIPALDGGRILFLIIEKIKGSPVSEEIEKNAIAFSFLILISIFILITINDIMG
jgi:regulator of sigma E protease